MCLVMELHLNPKSRTWVILFVYVCSETFVDIGVCTHLNRAQAGYMKYRYLHWHTHAHTRTHTLSFSLEHAQAGYINYCYSQQCIDRSSAPNSVKEGDKTLTDAWAQRTQDPPTPAGKVRVGNLCWYWMYVCRGIAVIWIPCDVCAWWHDDHVWLFESLQYCMRLGLVIMFSVFKKGCDEDTSIFTSMRNERKKSDLMSLSNLDETHVFN